MKNTLSTWCERKRRTHRAIHHQYGGVHPRRRKKTSGSDEVSAEERKESRGDVGFHCYAMHKPRRQDISHQHGDPQCSQQVETKYPEQGHQRRQ